MLRIKLSIPVRVRIKNLNSLLELMQNIIQIIIYNPVNAGVVECMERAEVFGLGNLFGVLKM